MAESIHKKKRYFIYLTEEQKETIQGIITFHGWNNEFYEDTSQSVCAEKSDNASHNSPVLQQVDTLQEVGSNANVQEYQFSDEDALDRCPHCLVCPCVTSPPQAWLGEGNPPRPGNNLVRKRLYRNYWTMLDRRGLWKNPLYLHQKEIRKREAHVELTMREIMPKCVLEQVRGLYPNPKNTPYMGHFW